MSGLNQQIDDLKTKLLGELDQLKIRMFGPNNERLDFLMDSFNKLDQTQQKGVIASLFIAVLGFVFLAFGIYFSQVSKLKTNLSESFAAIRQLEDLSVQFNQEEKRFDALLKKVQVATGDLGSFKSHFEQLSRTEAVKISSLNEKFTIIPDTNPLGKSMNEIKVDVDIDNVSLPKIMRYIVSIEKSGKFMKVSDLKIRSRYGTKLYFDTQMAIKGYKIK